MRNDGAIWRNFAIPGVVWLILFVVIPAYAVLAVAMGQIDSLLQPVPQWNPIDWNVGFVKEAFSSVVPGGTYWPATRNTIVFVAVTSSSASRSATRSPTTSPARRAAGRASCCC